MTDEMTPERLAEIKSIVAEKPTTCTKHGLRANRLVEHVPALIAQVERLTKRVEWLRGTVEDRDHQITYLETDREQETHFKIEAQQRAEAAEARATAAEADRDALLKAIGFTPGPLVPEVRRDFILQDAAGMRPAMVQARREARIVEGDALMWQYFCAEKGADRESGLLLKVWEQRRAAEARATAAEAALAREKEHTKRLATRIHNQRVNLRQNWMIVEARAKGHRPWPAEVRSRFLACWSAVSRRATAAEAKLAALSEQHLVACDRADAAEAKLAEAERRIERLLLTQRRLFEGDHVRLLEETEAKLADLASAVMEEAEPALGERMRCVRLARAVKEATP